MQFSKISFRTPRYLAYALIVAMVYFAAGELGLSLASIHTNVSPVWPPTGVAIASLLILGRPVWPAVFAGALATNLFTHVSFATAAGIATGNTLEALTAWYLLTHVGRTNKPLNSMRGVMRFVLFAVILSPAIAATIGNISLCLGSAAAWANFPKLWVTWWLGDGFGALVVAPFLLSWATDFKVEARSNIRIEGTVLLGLLFIASMTAFGEWLPGRTHNYPIQQICLPFLVWAALRFDQRLLCAAILLLSGVAVWATSRGYGPFVQNNPNESLLLLQLYIGVVTLTALLLHAVMNERKLAVEEKLRLTAEVEVQRQRISDIVSHVPGVVWEAWGQPDAANQQINFVSGYVEKMLGYTEEEWLSTPNFWLSIVHPEDRENAVRAASNTFTSNEVGVNRFRWITKDKRELWVESRSVAVADESGQPIGMRGVTMDITPAIRAEQERTALLKRERDARAQAEEASRLKDEFLANTSHELRTPLNAILGWSRLLRNAELDEKAAPHAVKVIERNARSLTRIVEDMLDLSRIITGKLRLTIGPTDLFQVISAAIDAVQPAADAKGIDIIVHTESTPVIVNGDGERLQQVVWNLLSNAVKFTQSGQIHVSLSKEGSCARITVADTGPGIAPDFLPHIFERFTQEDRSSTKKYGGLGLGLSIVRQLVELHGGTVEARNREGQKGAVFTVTLPTPT
ncbi:MAG: MASE1 domain-containing protein [Pyrinomonadaceae bacterium]